ncbi:MAG: dihydropteroate synthase [Aureispira sp.]
MVINCRGHLLSLEHPVLMGILNTTPDSFYKGSRVVSNEALLMQAEQMLKAGATILDIGGASSRPGAAAVSTEEELRRVLPAVEVLRAHFPAAILSVDTYSAKVAQAAFDTGAHLLNDISGGSLDQDLLQVVAAAKAPYVLMHMQGTPRTMQANPQYGDLMTTIADFFMDKIGQLQTLGVQDILLDVGFGFGKTIAHNYELLANLAAFKTLNCPLLVGISRKSMIWKLLENTPEEALNGTTALHMVALQQGAKILRVHDVQAANEVLTLWEQLGSPITG